MPRASGGGCGTTRRKSLLARDGSEAPQAAGYVVALSSILRIHVGLPWSDSRRRTPSMTEQPDRESGRVYVRDSAEDLRRWFAHRYGEKLFQPTIPGPLFCRRALQLNDGSEELLAGYGNRSIEGFVAFVDLKGFSTAVQGKSPREVHDFVSPFLQGVTEEAVGNWCLVDKTIGDEVMLFHPDMSDAQGPAPWLTFAWVLAGLATLQRRLGSNYRFKVGLAYGSFFLGRVGSMGFQEWTIFGEAVHLAKRLQGLDGLDSVVNDHGIAVALGLLECEKSLPGLSGITVDPLDLIASYLHGRFFDIQKIEPCPSLRGVSPYRAVMLVPNGNLDHYDPAGGVVGK